MGVLRNILIAMLFAALGVGAVWAAPVPAGVQIRNQAEATYYDMDGQQYSADSEWSVVTVGLTQSFALSPSQPQFLPVLAGSPAIFAYRLENTGNGIAIFSFSNASAASFTLYGDTNGNGALDNGENYLPASVTLAGGESIDLLVILNVPGSAGLGQVFTNTLTVNDDRLVSVQAGQTVAVVQGALYSTQKTVTWSDLNADGALSPGDEVTWRITGRNVGTQPIFNLSVADTLPAGLLYKPNSAIVSGIGLGPGSGVVFESSFDGNVWQQADPAPGDMYVRARVTVSSSLESDFPSGADLVLTFVMTVAPQPLYPTSITNFATSLFSDPFGTQQVLSNISQVSVNLPGTLRLWVPAQHTGSAGGLFRWAGKITNTTATPTSVSLIGQGLAWPFRILNPDLTPFSPAAPLAAGATANFVIEEDLAGASVGSFGILTLTAASSVGDDIAVHRTDVVAPTLSATPLTQATAGSPAGALSIPFTIQLNAFSPAMVQIALNSALWGGTVVDAAGAVVTSVLLTPGVPLTLYFKATIPPNAPVGAAQAWQITVSSLAAPVVPIQLQFSAKVAASAGWIAPKALSLRLNPGGYVDFAQAITNAGAYDAIPRIQVDRADATVSPAPFKLAANLTRTWQSVTYVDGKPATDTDGDGFADLGVVRKGATRKFSVRVFAPSNAALRSVHKFTFQFISSQYAPVQTVNKAIVGGLPRFEAASSFLTVRPNEEVEPGALLTYAITAVNIGETTAVNVAISDVLPVGLGQPVLTPDLEWDATNRVVAFRRNSLNKGESWTVSFQVPVADDAEIDQEILNQAEITADGMSPFQTNVARTLVLDRVLRVTKSAAEKTAETGDFVHWSVSVENISRSASMLVHDLVLRDRLPPGLSYVQGSSRMGGVKITDPETKPGSTTLAWSLGNLGNKEKKTVTFLASVDPLRGNRIRVNQAWAEGLTPRGHSLVSSMARASIKIQEGMFTDKGLIIGRVFLDANGNQIFDAGDTGISQARVYLDDGSWSLTDGAGLYHIDGARSGTRVARLDEITLPAGLIPAPLGARNSGVAHSQFVFLPPSGTARADFRVVGGRLPATPIQVGMAEHVSSTSTFARLTLAVTRIEEQAWDNPSKEMSLYWEPLSRPSPSAATVLEMLEGTPVRTVTLDGISGFAMISRRREFETHGFLVNDGLPDSPQPRVRFSPGGAQTIPGVIVYRLFPEVGDRVVLDVELPPQQVPLLYAGSPLVKQGDRWTLPIEVSGAPITFATRLTGRIPTGEMVLKLRDAGSGLAVTASTFAQVRRERAALKFVLSDASFDPGTDNLTDEALAKVELLGLFLIANPNLGADVTGYTDALPMAPGGMFMSNMALSRARAESVWAVWKHQGVPAPGVTVEGLGWANPVDDGDTPGGRARNERVEVLFHTKTTALVMGVSEGAVGEMEGVLRQKWKAGIDYTAQIPAGVDLIGFSANGAEQPPAPDVAFNGAPVAVTQAAGTWYFSPPTSGTFTVHYAEAVSAPRFFAVSKAGYQFAPAPIQTEIDRLNLQAEVSGTSTAPLGAVASTVEASDFEALTLTAMAVTSPTALFLPLPAPRSLTEAVNRAVPGILYPPADGLAQYGAIRVQTLVHTATTAQLMANGVTMPSNIQGIVMEDRQTMRRAVEWVGVPLKPGRNVLRLIARDQFGIVRTQAERIVWLAGDLRTMQADVSPAVLPADGRSSAELRFRLLDENGIAISGRRFITLTFEGVEPLTSDANLSELGFQARVEDGMALVRVRAPVDVRPGMVVARYGKIESRMRIDVVPPLRDWIVVGYGEGTLGYRQFSNKIEPADGSENFANGMFVDGRTSFFLRGKIKGEYLLTAAADTKRINTYESAFQGIQPDAYYAVYGDDSLTGKDAQTSGALYVKLEKNKSYLLWGDYNTAFNDTVLAAYNRVFSGAAIRYDSPTISAKAFENYGPQAHVVEELRGNGTSGLYFLAAKPIQIASERLELVIRDRGDQQVILSRRTLERGTDYDIDYFAGTLLFNRPVGGFDANFNPQFIRITYEVIEGDKNFWTTGARIRTRPHEILEVGATEVNEERLDDRYTMTGLDAKLLLPGNTLLTGELAQTHSELQTTGSAQRLGLKSHPISKLDILGEGYHVQSDYENPYLLLVPGSRGGQLRSIYHLTPQDDVTASQAIEQREGPPASVVSVTALAARHTTDQTWIDGRLLHVQSEFGDERDRDDTFRLSGRTPLYKKLAGTGSAEQSFHILDANAFGAGLEYQLLSSTRLYTRYENRSRQLVLVSDSNLAQPLPSAPSKLGGRQNLVTAGIETQMDYGFTAYSEYRGDYVPASSVDQGAAGLRNRYPISLRWTLNGFAERVQTLRGPKDQDHWAFGLGADYQILGTTKGTVRSEYRIGELDRSFLLVQAFARKMTRDLTLVERDIFYRNWGLLERLSNRAMLGAAWRPLNSDFVNSFTRLEYKREKGIFTPTEERAVRIAVGEVYLTPAPVLELFAKAGVKHVRLFGEGDIPPLITDLLVGGFWYEFYKRFGLGYEVRQIHTPLTGKRDRSEGAELGWNAVENVWLSGGYNWRGFHDRDFYPGNFWMKGPFIRIRFKFDERSLEGVLKHE